MLTDALDRPVRLATTPRRVVSLVPSLTEYLFAIGAGERLVGVTDFCIKPADQVAHLPRVRGTKNPDCDGICALQPDVVLASKEENRLRDVEALEAAGLPVYVTDVCSVADARAQLAALAHLLDVEPAAPPLLNEIDTTLQALRVQQATRNAPPPRLLAYIWRAPWMVVGSATYANDLLQCCGADNLALHFEGRYPRAPLEAFLQLDPQIILLPDEPYQFTEPDRDVFAPFPAVAAVRNGHIYLCDGKLLTWYGPRTPQALRTFSALFVDAAS
jgi:ABC-type Fe3+-hydroxamate transport system substrate-binding protein